MIENSDYKGHFMSANSHLSPQTRQVMIYVVRIVMIYVLRLGRPVTRSTSTAPLLIPFM